MNKKHTINAWMEDKPGVLNRVAGLFRRRNFNIDSLVVGRSETKGISRMTFVVEGNARDVFQVQAQLDKLINITRIENVTDKPAIFRELALVKVAASGENRHEVIQMAELHGAEIVDVTVDELIVQMVAKPARVESLIENLQHFGIIEMVSTGVVAVERSARRQVGEPAPVAARLNGTK
ncbi:MAG: acetolactate synthase-1/3 small subunit [Cellvibrionaceae bacterium]|jgi:acetolactate synthase-1/3 small subunit